MLHLRQAGIGQSLQKQEANAWRSGSQKPFDFWRLPNLQLRDDFCV